ncbi:MAG: murein L,D-transpeptidase catalytic domain family protein [Bacteroidota bacterium]|nr:murein L,D-transpeptidase catalytic domain family protein [Bacteroidota bacterium]
MGKYRIGQPYRGRFGTAYTVSGLDSSNNRALARHVVLHAYDCVPESETDPFPICNSLGCAMVSPGFLKRLQPIIEGSKRPILLWIFD